MYVLNLAVILLHHRRTSFIALCAICVICNIYINWNVVFVLVWRWFGYHLKCYPRYNEVGWSTRVKSYERGLLILTCIKLVWGTLRSHWQSNFPPNIKFFSTLVPSNKLNKKYRYPHPIKIFRLFSGFQGYL